jgi:hypothetical protein
MSLDAPEVFNVFHPTNAVYNTAGEFSALTSSSTFFLISAMLSPPACSLSAWR